MRRITTTVVSLAVVLLTSLAATSPALALSPWWHLTSSARPSYLKAGVKGQIVLTASNLGDQSTSGVVTISDRLPEGFTLVTMQGIAGASATNGNRGPVSCFPKKALCTFEGVLPPFDRIEVVIGVLVKPNAETGEVNEASVSGGGAPRGASGRHPITLSEGPTPFGIENYELGLEEEGGAPDTQAGSHPFQFTTTFALNQNAEAQPAALAKDLKFNLPAGLIGNPVPFEQCSLQKFLTLVEAKASECRPGSVVGVAMTTFNEPGNTGLFTDTAPIYNVEPSVGEPARFAFYAGPSVPVYLDASVRTGQDYGITVSVSNISQVAGFYKSEATFWGVPGEAAHDAQRGFGCLAAARGEGSACSPLGETGPPPFMTLPTSCDSPLVSTVQADSWEEPSNVLTAGVSEPLPQLDGCNKLPFSPQIAVTADGTAGSTPTGLTVDEHVPQESLLVAKGLAEANVKGLSVTLPEGVVINPAGADGLQACSLGEIGLTNGEVVSCPDASKVGTVRVKIPILPEAVEGSAYLAEQNQNPFGSLVAMYLFAENKKEGIRIKATGEVTENPVTGQLTAHFEHDKLFESDPINWQYLPQAPFEDVELHFFGGDRAPLATPALCGAHTTTGTFTPWSASPENEAAATVSSSSTFNITTGPNGSPCHNPLPFAPSLTAGTTSIQAGGFSPFTMTMSREDGNQNLRAISLHMPPGLSGLLSSVKLCGEAQANAGTCGPESEIGETTVSVGLGGDPFSVKGGKVFITEKYGGAPYGLSIVNPAKAGPFDLGIVVVRAKIEVDPITAALTITSDNTGPYKIPTILDGIPLQIKHVNVTINRPGFTFNPTNCNPMSITGSLSSTEGATAALSVPLQVTNCAVLHFKPAFSVSTSGKTSRANGASLHVKLVYPKAPFGSQANIRSVKVNLPKQLPSRLTTLQKACPDSTFNANPAACPPESRIGEAKATTPLLPVPLAGPVYFVSHGGAKFPELVIVLSGYGTTVQLHAETFISPAGITSSTFRTVPDVPVGTFELTLPQGKFSALAANGNLCKSKLAMPTAFTAQNGAQIKQSTPINVTGCKPSIAVMSQRVKGNTATIVASVPSAGRLVASGAGLSRASGSIPKAGTVTLALTLSKQEQLLLRSHPGRKLAVAVKLLFTPTHGHTLSGGVTVLMG